MILVAIVDFCRGFWWLFIVGTVTIVCFSAAALRIESVRLYVDGLLLRLPVAGTLNRKLQIARFARTLGALLNGGVRIVSAIKTTENTTTNHAFAKDIGNIQEAMPSLGIAPLLIENPLGGIEGEECIRNRISALVVDLDRDAPTATDKAEPCLQFLLVDVELKPIHVSAGRGHETVPGQGAYPDSVVATGELRKPVAPLTVGDMVCDRPFRGVEGEGKAHDRTANLWPAIHAW